MKQPNISLESRRFNETTADELLLAKVARNLRLSPLPALAFHVMETANRSDCSIQELANLISHEPAICGKLLGVVNSALYSLPRAVTSIENAIRLLGLQRVRSLVLALALPALQPGAAEGADYLQPMWRASAAGAIVAREVAIRKGSRDPANELVAGLLRDVGILALHQSNPQRYREILASPVSKLIDQQCEMEREELGLDHAEMSAYLLQTWRMPVEMTEAIRFHHHPTRLPSTRPEVIERAHLLHFASLAGWLLVAPRDPTLSARVVMAGRSAGLEESEVPAFLASVAEPMKELATLMDMDLGKDLDLSSMLAESLQEVVSLTMETAADNIRVHEEKKLVEKEQEETREVLRQTEEQLRQALKMEAVGRLAAGAAHDFNNLLTVINGLSELLLMELPPDSSTANTVREIRKAGELGSWMTRHLLAFSRKQVLKPEALDLNRIIRESSPILGRLIARDVRILENLDDTLCPILADTTQIQQILMNLIINAADAMPRGGKITLETHNVDLEESKSSSFQIPKGSFSRLVVRDTGCGMDATTRDKIFEPFFTTKDVGKGTGLGLSMVADIVRRCGGQITVESRVGEGTEFRVDLPHTDVPLATPVERPDPRKKAPQPPPPAQTILIVETDEGIRSVACQILRGNGYKVLEAARPHQVAEIGESHKEPIDLLLTDLNMPEIHGFELEDQLRGFHPNLKVLFTSGCLTFVLDDEYSIGTQMVLEKPYDPTSLLNKVREILDSNKGHVAQGSGVR